MSVDADQGMHFCRLKTLAPVRCHIPKAGHRAAQQALFSLLCHRELRRPPPPHLKTKLAKQTAGTERLIQNGESEYTLKH